MVVLNRHGSIFSTDPVWRIVRIKPNFFIRTIIHAVVSTESLQMIGPCVGTYGVLCLQFQPLNLHFAGCMTTT